MERKRTAVVEIGLVEEKLRAARNKKRSYYALMTEEVCCKYDICGFLQFFSNLLFPLSN